MTNESGKTGFSAPGYVAPGQGAPVRHGPPGPSKPRRGSLSMQLAVGFLGIALAAIALVTGLSVAFGGNDVADLVAQQREELTQAVAGAAGASWAHQASWYGADLAPVLDLGNRIGAQAAIVDRHGSRIAASSNFD